MKLFLKEKSLLIAVQAIQLIVILSIFWLDGFRDIHLFLYSTFLTFFLLGCYLIYDYLTRRKFYQRLTQPFESLDESIQKTDNVPISNALDELLHKQYQLYQNQLKTLENKQEEHRRFMDQWVHQMKTPLSVIELTAQNLDEPESSNIREETERMKRGLNTVLYMARLRTIEQDFHIKPVNLVKLHPEIKKEREFVLAEDKYDFILRLVIPNEG